MITDTSLLVISCERRKPIQTLWNRYQAQNWPDCPFRIDILSPIKDEDIGWNSNLIRYLESMPESYVLLMLDDHFPEDIDRKALFELLDMMRLRPDIAMVKLQAGNAHPPEIHFDWDNGRLGEYDRELHPFKRTNLVPTLFRREWLLRLSQAVLLDCGKQRDIGRDGAIHLEVSGTLLTANAGAWPERILGIWRDPPQYIGRSIVQCVENDAVREGRFRAAIPEEWMDIKGLEAFI